MWGALCDIGSFGVERPSFLRPRNCRPDFDKPACTYDDYVFTEARILAKLRRNNDPTAPVERPNVGTRKSESG